MGVPLKIDGVFNGTSLLTLMRTRGTPILGTIHFIIFAGSLFGSMLMNYP